MGDYTEVFLRAHIKHDAPEKLVSWFDHLANGDDRIVLGQPDPWPPYEQHPFFDANRTWDRMFCEGGAVYQISRRVQFRKGVGYSTAPHELICHVSAKYVPVHEFLSWIGPWLAHRTGEFLGYSLFEYADEPSLIVMPELSADRHNQENP